MKIRSVFSDRYSNTIKLYCQTFEGSIFSIRNIKRIKDTKDMILVSYINSKNTVCADIINSQQLAIGIRLD